MWPNVKGFEDCPTSLSSLFTHIMQLPRCDEASRLFSWTRSTSPNFRTANKSINQPPPTFVQNRLRIRLPPQQHGQQWLASSLSVSLGHKALLDKRNANLKNNGRPKTRPEPAVFLQRGESLPLSPCFVGRHVFKSFGMSCQSFLLGLFSCGSVAKSRCGVKSFHFASGS